MVLQTVKPYRSLLSGRAFFLVYFLDGWVMGLDRMKVKP